MVGELLGIEIPDCMLQQKPANYSTYAAHMQQVKDRKEHFAKELEEKKAHRKQKRGQDRSKQFKMDLMESRWFTGIPENFETDWCTVACPVGKRCLVMAIDGETKSFSKKGFKIPGYFLSVLPGGNGTEYGFGPTVVTLLDCLFHEEMMTYFILDCIMWASNDVKDFPYMDRMKFVKREISKRPEFKNITDLNMYKFVPLYQYDSSLEGIDLCMRQTTFEIDGLLFFKKDIKYRSESTSDILWIKPYILPDVFEGIAVPKRLMAEKPDTYTDFNTFIDDVEHGRIKIEPASKGGKKNKKKQTQSQGQGYGQGANKNRPVYRESQAVKGSGGEQNSSYSQLLAGGEQGHGQAIYGKGKFTGHSYYGDERDYYYPDPGYRSDMRARRDQGMAEMESAVPYNSRRQLNNKGRQNHLF
ncbi:snurportin-1-like [Ruditapes philippinarum]|uniref:snurportin-1-like n=1 Tax=Ruditapes philippinarum TaxID=129788 RepID=UPI00295BC66A|nr:snurportin-1-like [Ruditapes philippinarum]